jgi:hypothetical protein
MAKYGCVHGREHNYKVYELWPIEMKARLLGSLAT